MDFLLDKRVIKTKRTIKNAVIKLAEEKDLDKITVTDVAKKAIIQRNTFYCYYTKVNDVLAELICDICDNAEKSLSDLNTLNTEEFLEEFFYDIFLQLYNTDKIYKFLLSEKDNTKLMMCIKNRLFEEVIKKNRKEKYFSENSMTEQGINIFCVAAVYSFFEWLKQPSKKDFADYKKILVNLTGSFAKFIKNFDC